MLPLICLTLGLSFLCGMNLYLTLFLTSLAVQQGWVDPVLYPAVAAIGHPAVLMLSLLFVLIEFVLDKIPWVDSLWDAVHTLIRPVGAVLVCLTLWHGAGLAGEGIAFLVPTLGALIALSAHLTKSGLRLFINSSPEPFTNIIASLAEDITLGVLLLLLIHAPVTGFAVCLTLLAGIWILLPRLFRLVKTSVVLLWKKLTGFSISPIGPLTGLPSSLTLAQETQLRDSGESSAPAWAVPSVTGKVRQWPGLRAHQTGTLLSLEDQPGVLLFLYRGWFRRSAARLSLAGCLIRRETTMLSENLTFHQPADGAQIVFRFSRADAPLVLALESSLRCRLGLDAPSPHGNTSRSLHLPAAESATEIWAAPGQIPH